jgi:glutamine synthetase
MIELFRTQVLSAALKQQKLLSESLYSTLAVTGKSGGARQKKELKKLTALIEEGIKCADALEELREEASSIGDNGKRGKAFCQKVLPAGEALRDVVDALEGVVDDALWPLPKYREILFLN